jgi:muconolactone D-isomerase
MDFLVRMDTSAVYQLPDRERKELVERESMRGRELHADGTLRNVWRLPGRKPTSVSGRRAMPMS